VANPKAEEIDHDNTLLWRANARKLEAEAVRDAVLALTLGETHAAALGAEWRPATRALLTRGRR
jgi:hypothetical protein